MGTDTSIFFGEKPSAAAQGDQHYCASTATQQS